MNMEKRDESNPGSESDEGNELAISGVVEQNENNGSCSIVPLKDVVSQDNEAMLSSSGVAHHLILKEKAKADGDEEHSASTHIGLSEEPSKSISTGILAKQEVQKGIIYLSRIPPGLEPNALRSLLTPVGSVKRMWLRPENGMDGKNVQVSGGEVKKDDEKRRRWRKSVFRDGWVEFASRREAKRAVSLLNGQPMVGAKRRGRYADDLWAMRLLPGFTWDDLRREMVGSARERVLQVREEVASARRERAWVESRTALRKRIDKRRGKSSTADPPKPVRHIRQKAAIRAKIVDDEKRAAESALRVDKEVESGVARKLDEDLIAKLFKRKNTSPSS